ncbi:Alpha/Beta hydrolase protein, partial [Parasitella parasitica]
MPIILYLLLIWSIHLLVAKIHCIDSQQQHQQQVLARNMSSLKKNYRIRVKQPISSCENATQYSGYIDNLETDEHVFFLFLPSSFSPKTDPVVLMLHGEFDCSSIMDSWFQTGLCLIKKSSGIETNPFSFNHIGNLLYIELPSNVGFSHRSKGKSTTNNAHIVESIYQFLQSFFTEFHEFSLNDFHMSGSAYGTQYIPPLATRIIRENRYAESRNKIPIQLNSIILGNGLINPRVQDLSYVDYACDNDDEQYKPIYDKITCQTMLNNRRKCDYLLDHCKTAIQPSASCIPVSIFCSKTQLDPFTKTGLNPYDIRRKCTYQSQRPEAIPKYCYPDIASIENHLNQQKIRTEYGIDFEAGNRNSEFKSTMLDIEKILATPVRVLVYVGDMNYKYNWRGQKTWLSQLDWVGQAEFNKASDKDWISYVSGTKAGTVKTWQNIAFVKVFEAGQFAIYDQPANMIDLYSRWMLNMSLSY